MCVCYVFLLFPNRQTDKQADEGVRRVFFVSRLNINSPFVVPAAAVAPAKNMQIYITPTRYSSTFNVVVVCRVCSVSNSNTDIHQDELIFARVVSGSM